MCCSSDSTTTSRTELPAEVKPYIQPFLDQASSLAQREFQPYTGQRVADFTGLQNQGFNQVQNAIAGGNQANQTGLGQFNSTLSGNYLSGSGAKNPYAGQNNPFLSQAIQNAQSDTVNAYQHATAPQTDAAFARAHAFGGSAWGDQVDQNQRQLGNTLARQANDMRMADYGQQMNLAENQTNRSENAFQSERARQLAAMGQTGQFQQNGLAGAQALLGAGATQQGQAQQGLDNAYNDYVSARNQPYTNLDVMGNAISRAMGAGGSNTTTASGGSSNPLSSALGMYGMSQGLGGLGGLGGLSNSILGAQAAATAAGLANVGGMSAADALMAGIIAL